MMQRSYSNTITLIFIKYIDYSLPLFTFLDLTSVNFASFALASLDLASAEPRPSQEPPQEPSKRAPNDANLTTVGYYMVDCCLRRARNASGFICAARKSVAVKCFQILVQRAILIAAHVYVDITHNDNVLITTV